MINEEVSVTESVFRTAYFLAKKNRPFSDHPDLIELQKLNGLDCGVILHSRYSATEIINSIATEMKQKIIKEIINQQSKIAVVIDESTTVSRRTALAIYLKTCIRNQDPEFLFLALVELPSQDADTIKKTLLNTLYEYGLDDNFLSKNLLAFVSDGASVMLGKRSGVGKQMKDKFPNLFIWHCLNHRLELAVGDAIKSVTSLNHFQSFLDCLYSVYSQSAKNQNELKSISEQLDTQIKKIGRIFNVRWVASSFRTISAVWKSYEALNVHFQTASNDMARDLRERQKFKGLKSKISSKEFLLDLGLMHDSLQELSELSLDLQKQDMTIPQAEKLLKRSIRVLESFKEEPGDKLAEAVNSVAVGCHNNILLIDNQKSKEINRQQFIQSLVDNIRSRTLDSTENVADFNVFNIPEGTTNLRYGENQIKRLASRFQLDTDRTIRGMRAYIDGDKDDKNILLLIRALKTIPCSSAECERGFSVMNNIVTDTRSNLILENVSHLMFINVNGPPLSLFNPREYVKKWLLHHRSATDTQSRKVELEHNLYKKKSIFWSVL